MANMVTKYEIKMNKYLQLQLRNEKKSQTYQMLGIQCALTGNCGGVRQMQTAYCRLVDCRLTFLAGYFSSLALVGGLASRCSLECASLQSAFATHRN